jgi:MFS family permease
MTIYMIFQAISPNLWGPISDAKGRRPVLIVLLSLSLIANIGIITAPNWAALMTFRAIQSIGASATVSIGAGVIADIFGDAEKGKQNCINSAIRQSGIALGPLLGKFSPTQ